MSCMSNQTKNGWNSQWDATYELVFGARSHPAKTALSGSCNEAQAKLCAIFNVPFVDCTMYYTPTSPTLLPTVLGPA